MLPELEYLEENPPKPHRPNWVVVALVLATAVILMSCPLAFAGPREQVAVAEACVWAAQNQQPPLQPDVYQAIGPVDNPAFRELETELDEARSSLAEAVETIKSKAACIDLVEEENAKLLKNFEASQSAHADAAEALNKALSELKEKTQSPFASATPNAAAQPIHIEYVEPVGAAATPSPIHVVVITASWCRPCHKMREDNGDGDNQISFEYIDENDAESAGLDLRLRAARPVACWKDINGEARCVYGYHATKDLWNVIQRNNPPVQSPASARAGTYRIHARAQIHQAIELIRQYVGPGKSISFEWNRSGLSSFKLLSKSDRSALAIFGPAGQFHFSAPGAICPINKVGFNYQTDGSDFVLDPDPFRVPGLASKLSFQSRSAGAGPAQIFILDDVIFFGSLVSAINSITSFFSPELDLQLPGQVEVSAILAGDTLNVDWIKPPQIHFKEVVSGNLVLKKNAISETNIRVDADGPWFVPGRFKHRDIPVVD